MRLTPLTILNKPSQFQAVRKNGLSWHTPNFILSRLPQEADGQRVGFILTKKSMKRAVDRNRVKRRLRALSREILPAQALKGDYVLVGKASCLDAEAETLKKDMLWALKRLSCINPPSQP